LVLALVGIASAAATVTVQIPGIAGPAIAVRGALRTADGGAILLVTVHSGRRAHRALIARIDPDGLLALSYGYEGVADLHLGRGVTPTALAINPGTGDAWIGVTTARRSEVVAIDGAGLRRSAFGHRGVLKLPAADDGGVRALAWRRGELAVAAGRGARCTGCVLTLLNASVGRTVTTAALTAQEAGGSTCAGPAAITSTAFGAAGEVLAGTSVTDSSTCAASLLKLSNRLVPLGAPSANPFQLSSLVITPQGGAACVAGAGPAGIAVWPLGDPLAARVIATDSTRLLALVPLGASACGALLGERRQAAEIVQTAEGGGAPAVTHLPRALSPLAMSRCRQHLLVIAATGPRRRESAVIVPIPIARGPFAAAAAASVTTGCG
jgi:hypothetical protein